MANICVNCGRKLSGFEELTYADKLCNECRMAPDNKRAAEAAEVDNKRKAELVEAERAKFCVNCGSKRSFRDRHIYSDKLCKKCAIALDNKQGAEVAERENKQRAEAAEIENRWEPEAAEVDNKRRAGVTEAINKRKAEAAEAKNKLRAEVAEAENKRKAQATEAENKPTSGCCTECGKKLTLFTKSASKDMCVDCFNELDFNEKNKRRKGHCKGCGKRLPIMHVRNLDNSDYLRDLCSGCELKYPAKINAKYIGGYGAFPEPKDVKLHTHPDHLEVPELGLTIPYSQLQNVQTMTEEKLKASRLFLVGILAFAWKKRTPYLVLTFTDKVGIEQNPVFDVATSAIVFLYKQMLNAGTSKPAMPQPVPQPVPQPASQDDPMEKLAKLKNMVDAGLITEEEYSTKKGEILAKM